MKRGKEQREDADGRKRVNITAVTTFLCNDYCMNISMDTNLVENARKDAGRTLLLQEEGMLEEQSNGFFLCLYSIARKKKFLCNTLLSPRCNEKFFNIHSC